MLEITPVIVQDPKGLMCQLPLRKELDDGTVVLLDKYDNFKDEGAVYELFKSIVEEGDKYPYETMKDLDSFRQLYALHDVFITRLAVSGQIVGAFYIKPNFPDRCSHICNAGFMVRKEYRKKGIGKFMTVNYLHLAKEMGYKASYFNLVFVTNVAAIELYRSLGFIEVGRLPKAGKLKTHGYTDAVQMYFDLEMLTQLA